MQTRTYCHAELPGATYEQQQQLDQLRENTRVEAAKRWNLSSAIAALVPTSMGPGEPCLPHPGSFNIQSLTPAQVALIARGNGEPTVIPHTTTHVHGNAQAHGNVECASFSMKN